MTLPASGPISLLNLQEEFGGANPIAINEYYRGGVYVSSAMSQIPTSGVIDLNSFHGLASSAAAGAPFLKLSTWGGSFSYVNGTWLGGAVISNQGYKYTSSDLKTRVTDVSNLAALNSTGTEAIGTGCITSAGAKLVAAVSYTSSYVYTSVYASADAGTTWTLAAQIMGNDSAATKTFLLEGSVYGSRVVSFIGYYDATNYVVTPDKRSTGAKGVISTDDGTSWQDINFPILSNTTTLLSRPVVNCGVYCPGMRSDLGGDGLFVLGATDALYVAPDGANYIKQLVYDAGTGSVVTGALNYISCAFGNGTFVAGRSNSGSLSTSTDGANFYQQVAVPNLAGVHAIGFGNGYFVMVGTTTLAAPSDTAVWTSVDGVSWTYHAQLGLTGIGIKSIVFASGKFYLMATNNSAWAANA